MSFFTPFVLKVIAIGLLIAALVYGYNVFVDAQQQIGYDRRTGEYTKQENKDLKAALLETDRLNGIIKEAQSEAKKREEANQALSARNASLLGKLRDTDAHIDTLVSSATTEALRKATRAFSSLFGDCRTDFEAMGRAAAGHQSDVRQLEDSWPTKVNQ